MSTYTIWHNPRCSKSRQTLALLQDAGVEVEVRLYLQSPPSSDEIKDITTALGVSLIDMLRIGEKAFKDAGLSKSSSEDQLLEAVSKYPILIERPIVIHGGRALIGRPPEAIKTLL
jgi:arsenate reductase (glutaredoxin)